MRYGKYVYVHIQYIDFVRIVPVCQSWCSKWMMKMIKSNIIQVQADTFPLSYIATCAVHYILTQPYFKGVILIVFFYHVTHLLEFLLYQTISAEEHLVTIVSSSKPFLFDCLEFLYVPIILRWSW